MNTTRNTSHLILITTQMEKQWEERLRTQFPDQHLVFQAIQHAGEIPKSVWREVEVLYTSGKMLPEPDQVPHIHWVQLYSAGADSVLKHPLFQRDVIFTTTSGVHAINAAEYVFMMILAWCHNFPHLQAWRQSAQWPSSDVRHSQFLPEELWGKTLGIVGYGSIGRQVARIAQAFGMRILALQHSTDHRDHGFTFPDNGDPEGTLPDMYLSPDQLHTLLHESDMVVIALPLTQQTRYLFDEAAFAAMKPTSFLVNIARGEICDEHALLSALRERCIAGAALDVFNTEPLPSDHPFWHMPNVLMSPHITGETPRYAERALAIFEENLRRYLAHEPLLNAVNKQQGY